MFKTKRAKATLAVALAILLALTVGTIAFFADRVTHQMQFTTATFTDDGYTLTREAPNGPYAAGETIMVPITETNTGTEPIESSVKMTASWSSPDTATARALFNNAVTLKLGDETLDYEVSADKKSITFTLPDQVLQKNAPVTRNLYLTVPESFIPTGEVTFTFNKATVAQIPGFTAEYDSASSQFFIVHQTSPQLDGQYAAFGKVLSGIEVVDLICETVPVTDENGTVAFTDKPVINSIRRIDLPAK